MSVECVLAGNGARIQVSVTGYQRTEVTDAMDANWLAAHIDVSLAGFSATLTAALRTEDFQDLHRQVSAMLVQGAGVAEFETLEDSLRLSASLETSGRAAVTGYLRSIDQPRNQLSFAFDSDRTFLERANADLERVISAFPSRATTD